MVQNMSVCVSIYDCVFLLQVLVGARAVAVSALWVMLTCHHQCQLLSQDSLQAPHCRAIADRET